MKLIKSFMGRRQFLTAAGLGSASALAFGKLRGGAHPVLPPAAIAADNAWPADLSVVSDRYQHLMSPLKIGNSVLKNRMLCPPSTPHFLQGPENFPSEIMRDFYVALAKNGAGIINIRIMSNRVRSELRGDSAHMVIYDLEDYGVQNYLEQMLEGIHIYGSKASAGIMAGMRRPGMPGSQPQDSGEDNTQQVIDSVLTQAEFYKKHGFDALQVVNRTDKKLNAAACEAVKSAMPDMLVITELFVREKSITPHERDQYYQAGGTIEDAIAFAKTLEGKADIVMVRIADASAAHATTWNTPKEKPYAIDYAAAIKKSGAKIIVAPGGGFLDMAQNNEFIASGKTDMFTMARAFLCDPEYGQKMAAGRGDDLVPCIKCNKCHGEHITDGPWYTVCSVNPMLGIPAAVKSIRPPGARKKVAVIGGGPAGMQAAITAARRGHKVTLYEKGPALGGLLRHADYSPYKWAIKDFKDHLARQIDKAGVELKLNTTATPAMIEQKDYDTILVGVGSEPVKPKIPGVDGANVYNIVDAYPGEKSMGKNVVVIGGGEYGADVGMHLAKAGHRVTMLTAGEELVVMNRPHYPETIVQAYEDLDNFHIITQALATGISQGKVSYTDSGGRKKSINADSVVVYAGFRPKKDEALEFYGSARQFFTIGDCCELGNNNIQESIRSAFFTASEV
jgi:2,4-dienoyl-CoA reductase-like NADH-dependent reductase (Old Yellow Enzyme family)/thioredoxin reductase